MSKQNKKKTLSEFLLACTNIRSLCPNGKKSDLKIHAITNIKADIHIIVDSRLDENGVKKWKKPKKGSLVSTISMETFPKIEELLS